MYSYDNLYDWDLSDRDKMAPELTIGVYLIEDQLLNSTAGGGLVTHEKEDLKASGSGQAGGENSRDRDRDRDAKGGEYGEEPHQQGGGQGQPVMRIMSRGEKSMSQSQSQSHAQGQITSSRGGDSQQHARSHGYQTRTASNTMR